MKVSDPDRPSRRASPSDWVPFVLVVVGVALFFYLNSALPAPVSLAEKEGTFAVWGSFWVVGYLILFLQLRRRRLRGTDTEPAHGRSRAAPWGPAIASATLLGVGYLLLFGYLFLTSGGCLARGTCPTPDTVPWTFGLLTPLALVELVLVLTWVGILLLVLATWRGERQG